MSPGIPGRPGEAPLVDDGPGQPHESEEAAAESAEQDEGMGVSSERVGQLREGAGVGATGAGEPHPGAPTPATDQEDPKD